MSFKLNSAEAKTRRVLTEELEMRLADIDAAVEASMSVIEAEVRKINEAIRSYNTDLNEVRAFVEGRAETWQGEYDERSEAWQDSERGQAALEFIQEWEDIELEDLDEIELPDLEISHHGDHIESLKDLPEEAE